MTLLGVTQSLTGQHWHGVDGDTSDIANKLIEINGLDPILAKTYARAGARPETIDIFTNPKLRDLLPKPTDLLDLDKAAERINQAIINKERIAIFADYDVDGAASAALLIDYFRFYNIEATTYIPDRVIEGYGPNIPAMEQLADNHSLIIAVDCGTLSHAPIDAAVAKGAEVIVLDHHMAGSTLPNAITVNPNRQDCDNALGHLCAAGVVFLTLVAVNALKRDHGKIPNLMLALDIVALATVADVAPLVGVNRAFVRTGLEVIQNTQRVGLKLLVNNLLKYKKIGAEDIGFTLGPRLNAGGRIGRSLAATQLLTCQSQDEAERLFFELESQNTERRKIEAKITEEATAQVEAYPERSQNFIYASSKQWHSGVLGIVASRLKGKFRKPAIALAEVAGELHGSARSVIGVDLGGAVVRLAEEGLIVKGGGHKMAAGLTILPENLNLAMARLDQLLTRQSEGLASNLLIDSIITPTSLNIEKFNLLELAGPFGSNVPAPLFLVPDVSLKSIHIIKDVHIKYMFSLGGQSIEVMSFSTVGSSLDLREYRNSVQKFHVCVRASRNFWNGRESVQYQLEDIALA